MSLCVPLCSSTLDVRGTVKELNTGRKLSPGIFSGLTFFGTDHTLMLHA